MLFEERVAAEAPGRNVTSRAFYTHKQTTPPRIEPLYLSFRFSNEEEDSQKGGKMN